MGSEAAEGRVQVESFAGPIHATHDYLVQMSTYNELRMRAQYVFQDSPDFLSDLVTQSDAIGQLIDSARTMRENPFREDQPGLLARLRGQKLPENGRHSRVRSPGHMADNPVFQTFYAKSEKRGQTEVDQTLN